MSKTEKTERKKPVRRTDEERAQALREQLAALEAKRAAKDRKRHDQINERLESISARIAKLNQQFDELIAERQEIEYRLAEAANDSLTVED